MKRIYIIESFRGVVVNAPNGAYHEEFKIGRYVVKALLFPGGEYTFHIFRDDVLKAVISDKEWYISKVDGECQNLLNRLLRVYG